MKTTILLSVIMLASLLPVPCALAQRAGQDANALVRFQKALERDGFYVTPGVAAAWNLPADWCAYTPGIDNALYANNEPYVALQIPKSADDRTLTRYFQLGPDEAIVLIGRTPPPARYFSYTPYLVTRVYPTEKPLSHLPASEIPSITPR